MKDKKGGRDNTKPEPAVQSVAQPVVEPAVQPEAKDLEAFKGLIEIFKAEIKGEKGERLKPAEATAIRNGRVVDWFGEQMQTMLLKSILKALAESGHELSEPIMRELQTRLLTARSSNELMPWPVHGLGGQDNYYKHFMKLMNESKKAADDVTEMLDVIAQAVMADAKLFMVLSELLDGAMSVLKTQSKQFIKGDLPTLITLKVLEKKANMEKTLMDAGKSIKESEIRDSVKSILNGLTAVEEESTKQKEETKALKTGGRTRGWRKRRRTQRYRARFRASDFF